MKIVTSLLFQSELKQVIYRLEIDLGNAFVTKESDQNLSHLTRISQVSPGINNSHGQWICDKFPNWKVTACIHGIPYLLER